MQCYNIKTVFMKIKKILSILVISFLITTAIDSCSKSGGSGYSVTPPPSPPSGTGVIGMSGMYFSPSSVTVKVGQTVKWTNNDNLTHTVTSDDGTTFSSGNVAAGASFSFTPNAAGSFSYHCNFHSGMTGTVTVTN